MRSMLPDARRVVATYLTAIGRTDDANIVLAGKGDDFAEVCVAVQVFGEMGGRVARFERALVSYAEEDFWDAECPEASLAFHDRGDIARSALAGKELYAMHRD